MSPTKRLFLWLVDSIMRAYVARYGVDSEDRDAILCHLDVNVSKAMGLPFDPDVAGDYIRYLEGKAQ